MSDNEHIEDCLLLVCVLFLILTVTFFTLWVLK